MKFLIGIDGGWSKTNGILCDGDGRILAAARTRGSAIAGKPRPQSLMALDGLIARLCADAGVSRRAIGRIGLGLNGIDFADETADQQAMLSKALKIPAGRLDLVNDGIAALWGASFSPRAALVQHGSGVTMVWRARPGDETVFDHLDIAGLYDMRRDGFARTARMLDGRLPRTALADRILAHCGIAANQFVEWAYRNPAAADLRFTIPPLIFAAWREGDATAAAMVEEAANDYVKAMEAIARHLGEGPFEAAFGGGVILEGGAQFRDVLREKLTRACPQARFTTPALPAEYGAALLAAHCMGLDLAPAFRAMAHGTDRPSAAEVVPRRPFWKPSAAWIGRARR
jgi:N-acetylglucosamine kinase-like BadF-type ATPase